MKKVITNYVIKIPLRILKILKFEKPESNSAMSKEFQVTFNRDVSQISAVLMRMNKKGFIKTEKAGRETKAILNKEGEVFLEECVLEIENFLKEIGHQSKEEGYSKNKKSALIESILDILKPNFQDEFSGLENYINQEQVDSLISRFMQVVKDTLKSHLN